MQLRCEMRGNRPRVDGRRHANDLEIGHDARHLNPTTGWRRNTVSALSIAAFSVVALLVGALQASAHSPDFQPLGWSGPWSGGVVGSGHPEALCGQFPSNVCIVAGAYTVSAGYVIPLTRQPIRVINGQGLDTRYCTNSNNTPGWIVVIGVRGTSWAFQGLFDNSNTEGCNTRDYLCTEYTQASGWAQQVWLPANYYHQATILGTYWGTTCPRR